MPAVPWYVRNFNQDYLDIYGAHLDARTDFELAGMLRGCKLATGAALLDLACGHGRHAIPLAQRGFRVTGVDLSSLFLRRARQKAEQAGVDIRWLAQDMRKLKFRGEFDAALSFYNAFGFFDDEDDNHKVLQGVWRALKPGGWFFLDLLGLQAVDRETVVSEAVTPEYRLQETVSFDPAARKLTIDQIIRRGEGPPHTLQHLLRLYEPREIAALLERSGFAVVEQWGDFQGHPVDQGDRLITVARKPGD